jgi:hypothetical protein
MQKGYKIRLEISRGSAKFVRLDYSARGTLYRSAAVVVKGESVKEALSNTKVLDELAQKAGAA